MENRALIGLSPQRGDSSQKLRDAPQSRRHINPKRKRGNPNCKQGNELRREFFLACDSGWCAVSRELLERTGTPGVVRNSRGTLIIGLAGLGIRGRPVSGVIPILSAIQKPDARVAGCTLIDRSRLISHPSSSASAMTANQDRRRFRRRAV